MDQLEQERKAVVSLCDGKKRERDELLNRIRDKENEISRCQNAAISLSGTLTDQERDLVKNSRLDMELDGYLSAKDHPRYDREKESYAVSYTHLDVYKRQTMGRILISDCHIS